MVKKYFFTFFIFVLLQCSVGHSSELNDELIIKQIKDTFSDDILSSNDVYKNRKFYRKYPDKFETGPAKLFLNHSEPLLTLKTIVGEENFIKIPQNDLSEIVYALTNTFRRYAYEWLNSNINTGLRLKDIKLIDKKSAILIVERDMKAIPDLDLKLFIYHTNRGWKVYDFGFWDFRYSRMKRRLYLRYIKKNDSNGLISILEKKNNKFFK